MLSVGDETGRDGIRSQVGSFVLLSSSFFCAFCKKEGFNVFEAPLSGATEGRSAIIVWSWVDLGARGNKHLADVKLFTYTGVKEGPVSITAMNVSICIRC